jgi:hypothetical protein
MRIPDIRNSAVRIQKDIKDIINELVKSLKGAMTVIPAEAGIQ